ncbi:MAG: hypothetical protein CM1200mP40_10610 [Gammaproteobacteria bacterium]|nr:MAG: hypothetical protein CM1200mP40_10610 [Gammaproteobacteria bacterium]
MNEGEKTMAFFRLEKDLGITQFLQGLELPPLGNFEKLGGPLLTKSLLFIGQGFEVNLFRRL